MSYPTSNGARKTPPFTESSHATAMVRVTAKMACEKPGSECQLQGRKDAAGARDLEDKIHACEITENKSPHISRSYRFVWIINIIF